MAKRRVYISCYSCPHSTILVDSRNKRVAVCGLNGKQYRIEAGTPYPTWCERAKVKVKIDENDIDNYGADSTWAI